MPTDLATGLSTFYPPVYAVTPQGVTEIVNGLDAVKRWDGLTAALENSGVEVLGVGTFTGTETGAGTIANGTYQIAFRFLDDESQPGNLSALVECVVTGGPRQYINYTNIPSPTDTRTTQVQIFRSTAGQSRVLYLVATSASTVASPTNTINNTDDDSDADLQTKTALPINFPDGTINARRFGVPPAHVRTVIQHDERTFWGVPAFYSYGHAEVTNGSASVVIVGGTPTSAMIGRLFSVRGHATEYTISNVSGQTVTLSAVYTGTTDWIAPYSIYPAKATWRRIYFGYPGEPESVNADDAWDVQADPSAESALTGLYSFNSFVYVTTQNNTFRWSFQFNPNTDGAMYPNYDRGMLNPRAYCRADNIIGVMDRMGIYLTGGGNVNPISEGIQDYFRQGIVWERKEWFHAAAYAEEETMRFFVCLDGSRYPKHALCLNYTTGEWWVEEYPWEVSSSLTMPIGGRKRLLLGAEHERISIYGDSPQDGMPEGSAGGGRYTVASALSYSVTVSSPGWQVNADIIGTSIYIIKGRGRGQTRRIVNASKTTGRIDIKTPWTVQPDASSIVVVGGIRYLWRSDVLDMVASYPMSKKIEVMADPTEYDSNIALSVYRNNKDTPVASKGNAGNAAGGEILTGDTGWVFNVKQNQGTDANKEHDGVVWIGIDDGYNTRNPGEVRFLEVEVAGCTEREQVVLHSIDVSGAG